MEIEFSDDELNRLEADPEFNAGFSEPIVKAYRKRVQFIRSASDERELYQMHSFHFEKLKGKRNHQRSIRLNDQWRLIIEIVRGTPKNSIRIVSIEDYH